jgi:hypothetical protein
MSLRDHVILSLLLVILFPLIPCVVSYLRDQQERVERMNSFREMQMEEETRRALR